MCCQLNHNPTANIPGGVSDWTSSHVLSNRSDKSAAVPGVSDWMSSYLLLADANSTAIILGVSDLTITRII